MSSEKEAGRSECLEALVEALLPETLSAAVDVPLDRAAASYRVKHGAVNSTGELLRIAGDFLCHVEEAMGGVPVAGGERDREADALYLLERYYPPERGSRLDAALGHAAAPGGDLSQFLAIFLEGIRAEQRWFRVRAAFARYLDPLDWPGRVNLAGELLTIMAVGFGEVEGMSPPGRFAGEVEALVLAYIEAEGYLAETFGAARLPSP